jgi:hypothetical protein
VFETVWTCSNCKKVLARGGGTPALATCPNCGVRFVNGTQPWDPARGNLPAEAPRMLPPDPPAEAAAPPADTSTSAAPATTTTSPKARALVVGILLGGLVFGLIAVIGGALLIYHLAKPKRRASRYPALDDDGWADEWDPADGKRERW